MVVIDIGRKLEQLLIKANRFTQKKTLETVTSLLFFGIDFVCNLQTKVIAIVYPIIRFNNWWI